MQYTKEKLFLRLSFLAGKKNIQLKVADIFVCYLSIYDFRPKSSGYVKFFTNNTEACCSAGHRPHAGPRCSRWIWRPGQYTLFYEEKKKGDF